MYGTVWLIAGFLGLVIAFVATPKTFKKFIASVNNVFVILGIVFLAALGGAFTLIGGIIYAFLNKALQS
jgi:hypothetical protein